MFFLTVFFGDGRKKFFQDLFSKENTCICVLGPWPQAFLSLALDFFVSLALSLVSSTPPLIFTIAMVLCSDYDNELVFSSNFRVRYLKLKQ